MQTSKDTTKTLHLVYRFPPTFAGGARQALELAKGLRNYCGIDSFFIVANLENAPSYENYEGFPVYRIATKDEGRINYLIFSLNVCRLLFLKKKSFDLIHIHSIRPFYFLILLTCKLLKKPIVLSLTLLGHDDPISLKRKSLLWKIERLFYRFYNSIICSSSALKNVCLNDNLNNIAHIPCAISCGDECTLFKPISRLEKERLKQELKIPNNNNFIITFAGHLQQRKGTDILLKAWNILLEKNFPGLLIMIGPYDEYYENKELNKLIKDYLENSHERNVIFTGKVDYELVAKHIKISDCFVFPSRREGFGMVVVEAMACGVPVITSYLPGITEDIIDHEIDGIIIKDISPENLATAILTVYKNNNLSLFISNNAISKVNKKFSIKIIAQKHLELYKKFTSDIHG